MANLNTQSFASLLSNFSTAVQGSAANLVNFTTGSILRAIDEAVSYVGLWLQGLALQVVALSRAATSNNADLDSWFAQFGFARLPAVTATMQETFGRFTPSAQALIYPGASVQSQGGAVVFNVIADTTNSNYSTSLGAYVMPIGISTINVTVQCTTAGAIGNAQANTINSLATAISGVDYVNNAAASVNGVNSETDSAARSRFITFIASLEMGTLIAVLNAIASVQQGMSGIIAENQQYNGSTQYGYFTAIVNNGSGSATSTQLTNAANAIEIVRPLTVTFGVHAPNTITVNVVMVLVLQSGYVLSAVEALVIAAIQNYINSIVITASGGTLPFAGITAAAINVPGVANVTGTTVNGGTADLTATYQQSFQSGTIAVT